MRGKSFFLLVLVVLGLLFSIVIGSDRAIAQIATIIPTFTPMPTPTPRPSPTPQVFRCSCSSSGHPVVWAGLVQAPNYFFARQEAQGQCAGFYFRSKPSSAAVATPSTSSFIAVIPAPPTPVFNPCGLCACN